MSTDYPDEQAARHDALCRPMTMKDVLRRTGRSERTIERWVGQGLLTRYELAHPRESVFVEREVMELERDKRLAARQGRPRPPAAADGDGVDTGS